MTSDDGPPPDPETKVNDPHNVLVLIANGDYSKASGIIVDGKKFVYDTLYGSYEDFSQIHEAFTMLSDWKILSFRNIKANEVADLKKEINAFVRRYVGKENSIIFYHQGHGHSYVSKTQEVEDYIVTADGYSINILDFIGLNRGCHGCFYGRNLLAIFNKCRDFHVPRLPESITKGKHNHVACYLSHIGKGTQLRVSNGSDFARLLNKKISSLPPFKQTDFWSEIICCEGLKDIVILNGELGFKILMTRKYFIVRNTMEMGLREVLMEFFENDPICLVIVEFLIETQNQSRVIEDGSGKSNKHQESAVQPTLTLPGENIRKDLSYEDVKLLNVEQLCFWLGLPEVGLATLCGDFRALEIDGETFTVDFEEVERALSSKGIEQLRIRKLRRVYKKLGIPEVEDAADGIINPVGALAAAVVVLAGAVLFPALVRN